MDQSISRSLPLTIHVNTEQDEAAQYDQHDEGRSEDGDEEGGCEVAQERMERGDHRTLAGSIR